MNDVHYSSEKHDWSTPKKFFDLVNQEFRLNIDVCADTTNHKLDYWWGEEDDALAKEWLGIRCWMNPPFGHGIGKWVEKAFRESGRAEVVVCLLPVRTDCKWWHDYVMQANEIRFVRGRLTFSNAKNPAPFPCALVVFWPVKTNLVVSSMNRGY